MTLDTLIRRYRATIHEAEGKLEQLREELSLLEALQEERRDFVSIAGMQAKRLQDTLEASVIEEPVPKEKPNEPSHDDKYGLWVYDHKGDLIRKRQ